MGGILCIPNFIPPCIGNIRISLSTFNTLNTRYFCLRYLEHQDLFQTLDSGPLFWTTMGPIPSPSHGKPLVFIGGEFDHLHGMRLGLHHFHSGRSLRQCTLVVRYFGARLGPFGVILIGGRRCDMFEQSYFVGSESPQWDRIDTKGLMFSPGWMKFNDLLVPGHFGHLF